MYHVICQITCKCLDSEAIDNSTVTEWVPIAFHSLWARLLSLLLRTRVRDYQQIPKQNWTGEYLGKAFPLRNQGLGLKSITYLRSETVMAGEFDQDSLFPSWMKLSLSVLVWSCQGKPFLFLEKTLQQKVQILSAWREERLCISLRFLGNKTRHPMAHRCGLGSGCWWDLVRRPGAVSSFQLTIQPRNLYQIFYLLTSSTNCLGFTHNSTFSYVSSMSSWGFCGYDLGLWSSEMCWVKTMATESWGNVEKELNLARHGDRLTTLSLRVLRQESPHMFDIR